MADLNGSSKQASRGGFPLVALFLLAMVVAIVLVQVKLVFDSEFPVATILQSMVPCGLGGMLLGAIVGLHDLRRSQGLVCGLLVGLCTGALVSPIVYAGIDQPLNAFGTASVCAAGMIAMSTVYRRISLAPKLQKFR